VERWFMSKGEEEPRIRLRQGYDGQVDTDKHGFY
jgi:hypothetical protein